MFASLGCFGFPIIALAPEDAVDAYHLTVRAFALAERFRCPVFVITDKDVAMTPVTVDPAAMKGGTVCERPAAPGGRPYRFVPEGDVVPLQHFGGDGTVRFTGSTHDETAFITKDSATVGALNRHLVAKIDEHLDEIEIVDVDGELGARTLVVAYGVTAGAARRAVADIRGTGGTVSIAVVKSLWPVPATMLAKALVGIDRVVVPELNPGLYAREIEQIAGGRAVIPIERLDGELIEPAAIAEAVV